MEEKNNSIYNKSSSKLIWFIYCSNGNCVVSIIRSIGIGIQTPTVNSMIPLLVPEDKLMKFNGINSSIQSVIQFASPLVAGGIYEQNEVE